MDAPDGSAAPASGSEDDLPTFEELAADPEIAALLEFEPVPRRFKKEGGWSAEMQRLFIARLAVHGSPGKACDQVGMYRSGIDKLSKSPHAASFCDAWDGAVALAERRRVQAIADGQAGIASRKMPFVDNRRKAPQREAGPAPGEVLNERGEWEDERSFRQRADEARENIGNKLVRIRRLYLAEISACPGKRAAFEILTELPIDWDKAERGEAQADEPWHRENQRQPDMILLAESGWSFGEIGYGPDKKAEMRAAIDEYRAERGLESVAWEAEE
jgi:hypothetical protein